jgi:hypothetical protein
MAKISIRHFNRSYMNCLRMFINDVKVVEVYLSKGPISENELGDFRHTYTTADLWHLWEDNILNKLENIENINREAIKMKFVKIMMKHYVVHFLENDDYPRFRNKVNAWENLMKQ